MFIYEINTTAASFDPSVPVGTVLFTKTLSMGGVSGNGTITCESPGLSITRHGKYTPTGSYNTWPSPVAGVGYRMRYSTNNLWFPWTTDFGSVNQLPIGTPNIVLELVKTGPITAGGALTGEIAGSWVQNGAFQFLSFVIVGSIPIQPLVPTCRVTTPSIAVSLGNVVQKSLTGVGTTTSARPFNIQLRCSGGTSGSTTRMYTTLTDASHPANVSSVLSLGADSTASGVGIQVLRGNNDTLISYGPDSSQAGNPNQWFVGQFGNVDVTIPLKARYVQTAPDVKAGTANGRATFTMSYQ
ncbi:MULTISPECIES: fimbrial protein [Burkholderia]|uniref:Fimbrial family protein n=1 Tax=Burkholderia cepacia TaxID=292 RepID=A0AA88YY57_BURCE|nr:MULTISPECIES: fimbrial protein [Burkholderia]KGB93026.1 fimbrial family protein [Burkholderia cepacia]